MNRYSIASALLEIRKTSHYSPAAFANFIESVAVNKFNRNDKTILLYADYSALQIDADTHSIDSIDGIMSALLEIAVRIQALPESTVNDIPSYLYCDLLKWLRHNN